MTAEPLTPEQVEEMRRHAAWYAELVEANRRGETPGEAMIQLMTTGVAASFYRHWPSILATATHYHAMLRRMAKSPAGPAPAEGENGFDAYFTRPI